MSSSQAELARNVNFNAAGVDAAVSESGCGELCWAFIFLPGAYLEREGQFFAEAAFCKGGDNNVPVRV